MNLSVILPTFNERESINSLVAEIVSHLSPTGKSFEILVVDDDSPDGTWEEVSRQWVGDSRVRPLLRKNEKGLATAILHGIRHAAGDKIIVMDTDFNHPPRLIPLLVAITDYFSVASGSRYVIGGGMETSRFRYIGSKLFNKFVHYVLKMQTTDNLSGYFCFRKEVLEGIPLEKIFFGYGDFYIRFLYVMQRRGHPIIEVPVVYKDRMGGLSKTDLKSELFKYFRSVMKIRFGSLK
jgi:dolichol-phosphate mannosyltransferase